MSTIEDHCVEKRITISPILLC